MKNPPKEKLEIDIQSDKLQKEIQPVLHKYDMKSGTDFHKTVKDWNAKILKLTMRIKDQYPELSKYLEEMPVTVPDEKNPALTILDFKKYYNSLSAILDKYILEYPKHSGYEK